MLRNLREVPLRRNDPRRCAKKIGPVMDRPDARVI
jgi:hypothetical protein